MQRRLCIKLLSKFPQNPNSITQNPIFNSSFSKANANPFQRQHFYEYSTFPHSKLWKNFTNNEVYKQIRNGFFVGTVLGKRCFSNTLLKGQGKVWTRLRRDFHSFDSQYGGWRSYLRRLTPDGVVIGLVVANVAVFLLWRVADPRFMVNNFMISVDNFTSGRVHTLITSAFSHRDMWHLASNMIGLYFFGLSIGRTYGSEYLLKLYLSGAIVGSIFYLAYHAFIAPSFQKTNMFGMDPSRIPGLGASGAVNAIMLLDIFLYPTKTLYLDFFIPVPAILLGIFIVGKDLLRILEGDHEVSGSAHLGGATVAALAWMQSRKGRFRRF